jgi:Mg/Co/Ni transporter MgtE
MDPRLHFRHPWLQVNLISGFRARMLVAKETWLGFLNGVTAGVGMLIFAKIQGNPQALICRSSFSWR